MRKRPSAYGLCKPHKKWKQRDVRKTSALQQALFKECGASLRARVLK